MPRPYIGWRALGLLAAAMLLLAAGGCGKKTLAPHRTDSGGLVGYPLPTSPQNVLQNLILAYTSRDSVETAIVYDSTYQGISTDPSAPIPILNFTRADEIRHVGALKRNTNIVTVFLDLGAASTWHRLPGNISDPPGWAIIPIPANTVRIDDVGRASLFESVNRNMEFTFKPTVTAPGDTTWTVVRWTESTN